MPTVFVLNGPNLNLLGTREPEIYGRLTLEEIAAGCRETGRRLGLDIVFRQTNSEGELVNWIQEAIDEAAALVINAAAYTHTSVAVLDALRAFPGPIVEVHLSNPHRREAFRARSYVSPVADGVICGFGGTGYRLALEAVAEILRDRPRATHRET